jgi:drug/metabolite transporter (DMT)-like permease
VKGGSGLRADLDGRQIGALLVIYAVWGSTYLAIRYAIETLPTFTMAGTRFLVAGSLLFAWGLMRGGEAPSGPQWLRSLGIGTLLLLGGNGGVVWAEHRISSGIAALLIAVEPVWVALLAPLLLSTARGGWRTVAGLALGVGGVAVLVLDSGAIGADSVDPLGAMAVIASGLSWAVGSLWATRAELPSSRSIAFGAQMLCGSAALLAFGASLGEWGAIRPETISFRSVAALVYLVAFGSIAAYSAYGFLLRTTAPIIVSTYAFVNPLVAVLLGWLLADEPVGRRLFVAAVGILGAVALILRDELLGAARRRVEALAGSEAA